MLRLGMIRGPNVGLVLNKGPSVADRLTRKPSAVAGKAKRIYF